MENDIEVIRNKLEKYMKAKIPVHVVFKFSKDIIINDAGEPIPRFFNGYLTGKKSKDVYKIDERKLGKTFFLIDDVYDVNVYTKDNYALARDIKEDGGFKLGEGVSSDDIDLVKDIKEED